jgi:hypothetical protein
MFVYITCLYYNARCKKHKIWYLVSYPELKRSGSDVDHSQSRSSRVSAAVGLLSLYAFSWRGQTDYQLLQGELQTYNASL